MAACIPDIVGSSLQVADIKERREDRRREKTIQGNREGKKASTNTNHRNTPKLKPGFGLGIQGYGMK